MSKSAHRTPIRVYYEDTDSGGIVYYANYLKFAERGRTELLRSIGFDHRKMADEYGLGFVVRRCCADYRKPARLDDLLTVETSLVKLAGASAEMAQRVLINDTILCELAVTLGLVDGTGRPRRFPDPVRASLTEVMESGSTEDNGSATDVEGKG